MLTRDAVENLTSIRIALERSGGGVIERQEAISWLKRNGLAVELTYFKLLDAERELKTKGQ